MAFEIEKRYNTELAKQRQKQVIEMYFQYIQTK